MSVHICIETLDGQEHPDWDWSLNGGHKEFAREIMHTLPSKQHQRNDNVWMDDTAHCRPTDFTAWRSAIIGIPNQELFEKMLNILEADERYWIYVSQ